MTDQQTEAAKRDAILDTLEVVRVDLVRLGKEAAVYLSAMEGGVTSVRVAEWLRAQGHGPAMDAVDARWMGCLFRSGWRRVGYAPVGSHKRPCAVWERET